MEFDDHNFGVNDGDINKEAASNLTISVILKLIKTQSQHGNCVGVQTRATCECPLGESTSNYDHII